MGLFSLIGGIIGGGSQKKASRKAEQAQIDYGNKAIGEITSRADQAIQGYAPWLETGSAALGGQADLLGLNGGDEQGGAIAALQNSPLFKMLFDQGEEAILQNASATGGLRGGNTQRSLADFGADTLSKVIQQQLDRLGGLSGQGLQAAGGGAGVNMAAGGSIADIFGQQGAARAGGLLTRGGINAANWNNAGSYIDDAMKKITGFGGF